jgi:mono/diheme cytochrome c family protein
MKPAYFYIILPLFFIQPSLVSSNPNEEQIKRGEYIFNLGGCASCHTAKGGQPLAGGVKMETRFGDFYTPNITPDKSTGIGNWSDTDFINAMTRGLSPEGLHYYPSFPYTSYSNMKHQDLIDLKKYLDKQPAVIRESKAHDLKFPFNIRPLLFLWKLINFDPEPFNENSQQTPAWNRGAYIVNGPGHCTQCHSSRNILGGLDSDGYLSGNPEGPEGEVIPGITQNENNRISEWTEEDLVFSLQMGMIPDGDFLGGSMGHVIENTTSKLTQQDLEAIVSYLKSIKN